MGTSGNRPSAEDQLYKRGESFRIPGLQIDGMDVLAVRGAATTAPEWGRGGNGPILLELKTYRHRGQSMSAADKYGSRDEVHAVQIARGRCMENVGNDGGYRFAALRDKKK